MSNRFIDVHRFHPEDVSGSEDESVDAIPTLNSSLLVHTDLFLWTSLILNLERSFPKLAPWCVQIEGATPW